MMLPSEIGQDQTKIFKIHFICQSSFYGRVGRKRIQYSYHSHCNWTILLNITFYIPLTRVYSKVTKMMKMESNTESAKMSLLKELFISLDERTVIVRRFPINPNTPTRGCYENILINSFIDVLSVFTIQTPSK